MSFLFVLVTIDVKNREQNMMKKQQIEILLILKLKSLKSSGVQGLTLDDLYYIFNRYIWKNTAFEHVSEIAESILNTSDDMIVRWISIDSTLQGYHKSIDQILEECDGVI